MSFTSTAPVWRRRHVERPETCSAMVMKYSSQDGRGMRGSRSLSLLGAEEAVAGVAEAGHDVAVVVEVVVDRAGVDAHVVAARSSDLGDALGRRDEHEQLDVPARPARAGTATAAAAEPPVASIGSTMSTSRSPMSSGSLQ